MRLSTIASHAKSPEYERSTRLFMGIQSSKRYCHTRLGSQFRALPVYIKRGCAALPHREGGLDVEARARRTSKTPQAVHREPGEAAVARRRNRRTRQGDDGRGEEAAQGRQPQNAGRGGSGRAAWLVRRRARQPRAEAEAKAEAVGPDEPQAWRRTPARLARQA